MHVFLNTEMNDKLMLVSCIIWGLKGYRSIMTITYTLVIQHYEHWVNMLLGIKSTSLLFKRYKYYLLKLWGLE